MNVLEASPGGTHVALRAQVRCPHCWTAFPPQRALWIASHAELAGDVRLGEDARQRFLPSRFNVNCQALDARGEACQRIACPECHIEMPRTLLEFSPLFLSILGAPGSGKSYFLASSIWRLRQTLRERFRLAFSDADASANLVLSDYEERLFLNPNRDAITALPKTETEGDLYHSVSYDGRVVWYPRAFVFGVEPQDGHPLADRRSASSRAVCLYDNAGEHFLPGGQSGSEPSTRHLSVASALLYLFDPTQHMGFRERMTAGGVQDPQVGERGWSHRQDLVLAEASGRIRAECNLSQSERHKTPMIVVVTKYDAWRGLLSKDLTPEVVVRARDSVAGLHVAAIEKVSRQLRRLLQQVAPEVVAAAEGICQTVVYLPASATGCSPEFDPATGMLGVRPRRLKPLWSEIPLLYALHLAAPQLVPAVVSQRPGEAAE